MNNTPYKKIQALLNATQVSVAIINCISIFSAILLVSCNKIVGTDDIQPYRTVIVYMAADNDLSDDAWKNISEIQKAYVGKGVNLIVFIDSSDDLPQILQIEHGGFRRIKTFHEFSSVDAIHFNHLLISIIDMYPAASYGLILWSHGTSWLPAGVQLRSFGEDNGRQMDITTLAAALPVKFDFILLDACLMGSVEVAYELRNKTDFIIASATEIIYSGFPYGQVMAKHWDMRLRK